MTTVRIPEPIYPYTNPRDSARQRPHRGPMGRDLPTIGNCAGWNLHRQCWVTSNLLVDNSGSAASKSGHQFCEKQSSLRRLRKLICGPRDQLKNARAQSNRLDTDSSVAVRPIASPIGVEISN